MTCNCACTANSLAVSNMVPWSCNQFGQVPPTLCSPPCNTGYNYGHYGSFNCGGSSAKQERLGCFAAAISQAYQQLRQACITFPDTVGVLAAQKTVLLTTLTTYNTPTSDPVKIFERDDLIQQVKDITSAALHDLSLTATYTTIVTFRDAYYLAINDYFDCVVTAH